MSYTITYNKIPESAGSKVADVSSFVASRFKSAGPLLDDRGNVIGTRYSYEYGSSKEPVSAEVKSTYDAKSDMTRTSIRVRYTVTVVTDWGDTSEEIIEPNEVVIAWNYKGKLAWDTDQLLLAIQATTSLVTGGEYDATTGLGSTAVLDALNYGRTNNLWD
jgi:hypothetical protein